MMTEFELTINGKNTRVSAQPDTPLLWVLRDFLNLKGTKYGCGLGICGICTIHLNGEAIRSCQIPIKAIGSKEITTIEGLSLKGEHPVQQAWEHAHVPQCGYCQTGQIMQAAAIFNKNPDPNTKEIESGMSTVLCRCGTYSRIKEAMELARTMINDAE